MAKKTLIMFANKSRNSQSTELQLLFP
jgi:hypothetical protein